MIGALDWPGAPSDTVAFSIDGRRFSTVPTPPTVLLGWFGAGNWPMLATRIVPAEPIWIRLYDHRDPFELPDAFKAVTGAWSRHAGVPWFAATQLAAYAVTSWADLDGAAAHVGFDPASQPLRRTLAFIRHTVMSDCKDIKERKARDAELGAIPREYAGAVAPTAEQRKAASDSFKALSGMLSSLR